MKKQRIVALVLGGGSRVEAARLLKRSAGRLGIDLNIVSYELGKGVPIAVEGEVVTGLEWSDPHVVSDVARVAIEHEAAMLIPFADGAISVAAACSKLLGHVFTPMRDVDTAEALYDRKLSAEAFSKGNIPAPRTYNVINAEVPVIAKPVKGSTARNIRVFREIDELMQLENLDSFLLQEFIEDFAEFSVDCYVSRQGEIMCTVPVELLEVRGGMIWRAVTRRIPDLTDICRRVVEYFRLEGPVTVETLYDRKRHRYVVTHVAPRFSDAMAAAVYSGAPLCDYLMQEYLGVPLHPCDDWAAETCMSSYLSPAVFFRR